MKNIFILPTNKPSRLYKARTFDYGLYEKPKTYTVKNQGQHVYITSDEEIKEGDWILDNILVNKKPIRVTKELLEDGFLKEDKKIILTTDPDLIADGIQSIDDEFLEWFVKNPSCEYVEVKQKQHFEPNKTKRTNPLNGVYYSYKILIPKKEPKQELPGTNMTSFEIELDKDCFPKNVEVESANGEHLGTVSIIPIPHIDYIPKEEKCTCENPTDNTCDYCEKENKIEILEEAKKRALEEELEEAANRLFPISKGGLMWMPSTHDCNQANKQEGFIVGAKWQAERMYSEEDLLVAFEAGMMFIGEDKGSFREWFEQYKKK